MNDSPLEIVLWIVGVVVFTGIATAVVMWLGDQRGRNKFTIGKKTI